MRKFLLELGRTKCHRDASYQFTAAWTCYNLRNTEVFVVKRVFPLTKKYGMTGFVIFEMHISVCCLPVNLLLHLNRHAECRDFTWVWCTCRVLIWTVPKASLDFEQQSRLPIKSVFQICVVC